jgi:hypothetical protein
MGTDAYCCDAAIVELDGFRAGRVSVHRSISMNILIPLMRTPLLTPED